MDADDRIAAPSTWFMSVVLAVPMAGLALLLGVSALDVRWEHHPSHFWLVFGVALVNVALGLVVSETARRSGDERLFLVSMVLLTSAGLLAHNALVTPGVVLSGPNGGFGLATPIGLLLASGSRHSRRSRWMRAPRPPCVAGRRRCAWVCSCCCSPGRSRRSQDCPRSTR